jgi:psiF repeat
MRRRISILIVTSLVSVSLLAIARPAALAQAPTSTTESPAPKPSKLKLTKEKLQEMLTKWRQNRPKLRACRAEARKKGLDGDDRWFFISDCMDRT